MHQHGAPSAASEEPTTSATSTRDCRHTIDHTHLNKMAHSALALILLLGTLSVTVATFLGERTKLWFMTDSGIAIIVGLVLGGIHYIYTLTDDVVDDTQQLKLFEFQPGIFTLLLLPPIIFESGYNHNHRSFFAKSPLHRVRIVARRLMLSIDPARLAAASTATMRCRARPLLTF